MGSLQRRLDVGLILSLVVIFLLQWIAVSRFNRQLTEGHVTSRLKQDGEGLLAALQIGALGTKPILNPERVDPIYKRPFSGRYFQILSGNDVLRSRSLWDQALSFSPLGVGQSMERHVSGPQGQGLLLLVSTYRKQNETITIAIAEDLSAMEAEIRRFQLRYAALSLAILTILVFVQRKIVHSGLAPLERGRRDMALLERGEIAQLSEAVPDEVKPFVKEINRLIEGMSLRLTRSRKAMGNLAHALKGPLTLLTQTAERPEIKNHPEIHQQLIAQTGFLGRLLDRELKRARLAGSGGPAQRFEIEAETAVLFDALKKIHRDKELEIVSHIPPGLRIAFDREDLLELLGNLLDNACKWAKGRVVLRVARETSLLLIIEDDGPGVTPEALTQLSDRGLRLDESIEGFGLGLAIAKEIVAQYSGEIHFGASERLGGFQVSVSFPCGEASA